MNHKINSPKHDRCITTFEVGGLNDIMWWFLDYGDQVKVISPKALRDKLKNVYTSALKQCQ